MENIQHLQIEDNFTNEINDYVIINKGNGHFVSMRKKYYEQLEAQQAEQSTPLGAGNE
jgi:hypothetical protein